mgnify:FL=1
MGRHPEQDGQENVVFFVQWRCIGVDGNYGGSAHGLQGISIDFGTPFTPYADLTQDQVIGWVKSAMGDERVAQIEASVNAQIEAQKNPPAVIAPLPW